MKAKNDYELSKEVQYWAGRLIGHEQNYEIAQEIVDAINNAEEFVKLNLPVVNRSKHVNLVIDFENNGYTTLTDEQLKQHEDNNLFEKGTEVYRAELIKEY